MLAKKTIIPTRNIGPIKIIGSEVDAEVRVPLATFETPLWPSVNRGARISRAAGGINVEIIRDCMTRSILLEGPDVSYVAKILIELPAKREQFKDAVKQTSCFAKFQDWHAQVIGNLLYLRLSFNCADAAGHNMSTKAAEAILDWLLNQYTKLKYVSISGNYCVAKKVSAVNGILGRGKYVVAELLLKRSLCIEQLRSTPEKIVELNIKKNLLGSIISGGVCSANAHVANMLLAFYLATGQDAANLVEGSQGITHAEVRDTDLYFSVTLPNVIVGTIGNGKHFDFAKDNLQALGCLEQRDLGKNSRRLAIIATAVVLCGELSLLAAQTNRGELMLSHVQMER